MLLDPGSRRTTGVRERPDTSLRFMFGQELLEPEYFGGVMGPRSLIVSVQAVDGDDALCRCQSNVTYKV